MVTLAERHALGHGLQGMCYPPAFDEWCHELLCISPAAYRIFCSHFGGRTERSFHQIRSKIPIFHPGVTPCTYERARQYCLDYNYPLDGPLAIRVDDTSLLEAIRPFFDPVLNKWFAIGLVGDPVEVMVIDDGGDGTDEFRKQLENAGHMKAEKLRLWTLQIPLSRVPPLVIAVAAISSGTNSSALARMDESLLKVLMKHNNPLRIISVGSDGAISERKARQDMISNLINTGEAEITEYLINHPDGHSPRIAVPLIHVFGQVLTIVQDSKHCRKTLRNNLFSGARAIVLAQHVTFYQQVHDIANDTARSPLHRRDVERLDRQDDRAAERLFSSATLRYAVSHLAKPGIGLSVYLFICGDLVDAYQSRKVSHAERILMILRAKFFKDLWRSFLHDGGYNEQRYFISRDADNIIDTLISGLLGLIIIHRDTLGQQFPLMPWTHGSESNEHVFGLMRSLISDFTMLDVLRMIPKLTIRLQAACRSRYQHFGETAAGYSHTYFQDDDTPSDRFSQFPSDQTIDALARTAYSEATYLWSLLGYDPCETPRPANPESQLGNSVQEDLGDDSEDSGQTTAMSDRRELLDALEASSHSVSQTNSKRMNEYMFATAALNLQDFNDLYVHVPRFLSNRMLIIQPVTRYLTLIRCYWKILQHTYKPCCKHRFATLSCPAHPQSKSKIKTDHRSVTCPSLHPTTSYFLQKFDNGTRPKKPRKVHVWQTE